MSNFYFEQVGRQVLKRRAGRPTPEQALVRDRELLDASRNLFLRYGYQHVSIGMISVAAGVSTRTVYTRFGGKPGLLATVIEREQEQRIARLERLLENGASLDACLLGAAEDLLENTLCPCIGQLQCDVVAERDRALIERLQQGFHLRWKQALSRIFDRIDWRSRSLMTCDSSLAADMFSGCVLAEYVHQPPYQPAYTAMCADVSQLARARVDRFLRASTGQRNIERVAGTQYESASGQARPGPD